MISPVVNCGYEADLAFGCRKSGPLSKELSLSV
jgi:hypothetical protein